jgi:precorrin-3B synthase
MTAAPAIKGWCPTLLSPMLSGDGWLVRIKPTAGRLSAAAARIIAQAARRHGNGHIDLSSRANFQIRGLSPRSAEELAETIIGEGLASANEPVEAIRNVMASPLGPDDSSAAFDSHAFARDIEAMLAGEPALRALPPKFGILVDAGGVLPLADIAADIMVRAHGGAFAVYLDGWTLAALCPRPSLAETVRVLASAFLRLSGERNESPRRMRALVMMVGEAAIFAAAGLMTVPIRTASTIKATSPIGFIPYSGGAGALGIGLPFGRIEADALMSLADLSERYGDGSLRTTPWRALLLTGISAAVTEALRGKIRALDLIADPADPRLNIFACVGAPACQSSSVDTRSDASYLATAVGATPNDTIHVSGCIKACAHRGPAALTLVGRDGRYDLIRNGTAGDRPSLTGLGIKQVLALSSAKGRRP